MINFDMLMNSININNKSSFNKSDAEIKSVNFEDVIKNQNDCENVNIDRKNNKNNNLSLNNNDEGNGLGQLIDSPIKDKSKFIDKISEVIEEDLSEENAFDIINIFLVLNTVENNSSISFKNIEFIDIDSFSEEYLSLDNTFNNSEVVNFDFLGKFVLEKDTIKAPLYTEKEEFKVLNTINDKESINIGDIFEQVIEEYFELEINNKDNSNQNESILTDDENIFKKINKKDIYNKLSDKLSEIEDFNSIEYKNLSSLQLKNDCNSCDSSFNDFLINQRLIDIKSNKNIDDELELLIKIQNLNSEITDEISPYSYRLIDNLNDKINENIQPQILRYSHFESDLVNTINHMKNSNLEELTIKVRPKELGEIIINLRRKNGLSEVVIFAEKEDLFASLKRDISRIETEIKKIGLDIDNISIEMKKQENSSFDFNNNHQGNTLENGDDYKKSKRESKDSNKKDKTIDKDDIMHDINNKSNDLNEISILA